MPVVASSAFPLSQGVGDDHARSVDTHMELLPAARPAAAVFRGGPFTFAHDRESHAVDDEMHTCTGGDATTREGEALAPPGERCVIGRRKLEAHHREE